jgi:phosphatidylinositol alpha-1,6-mannosyltransferase
MSLSRLGSYGDERWRAMERACRLGLTDAAGIVRCEQDPEQGIGDFACYLSDSRSCTHDQANRPETVREPRTLFITQDYPPDRGGIARLYGELCDRMPHVQVSTVAASHAPPTSGAAVHRMSFGFRRAHRPINILRWARWSQQFIRRHDVRLVHAGNVRPSGYVAAILRRQLGIPYVVYVHGKDLLKERRKGATRWLVRAGTREILGNASAIVANSAATARLARDILRGVGAQEAAGRVHVIHPGADPARFAIANQLAGGRPRTLGDGPVLLSVARLVPRKGIDTVIESLPAIRAIHPSVVYRVIGTGPDLSRLQDLTARLGVADRVRFVGDVEDDALPAWYAGADLFVLPTREIPADDEIEGFGIAYVEAAAAGVPSIAADVGGCADAVIDDVTGLLVPPGSPSSVANAVLLLLRDPTLRARLGRNARATVERHLNWERAAREVMGLVSELTRPRAASVEVTPGDAIVGRPLERERGRA